MKCNIIYLILHLPIDGKKWLRNWSIFDFSFLEIDNHGHVLVLYSYEPCINFDECAECYRFL